MYSCMLLTCSEEKRYFLLKTKYQREKKKRIKQTVTFSQGDYKLKQFSKFYEDFGQNPLTVFLNFKFRYFVFILSFNSSPLYFTLGVLVGAVCMRAKSLQSCLTLCDAMHCSPPAPPSVGFSRQEYWRGLPCPPPGGLLNSGIEPCLLEFSALAGGFFTPSATWEAE